MGKRSHFPRKERDCYDTPPEAVRPLLCHLPVAVLYCEPCAGAGHLIEGIEAYRGKNNWYCPDASDVAPRAGWIKQADALDRDYSSLTHIITNPPWGWGFVEPFLERTRQVSNVWLLLSADFAHNKRSAPYMARCSDVVAIGRVKWIPGSTHSGKDNCAWYRFQPKPCDTIFHARDDAPRHAEVAHG